MKVEAKLLLGLGLSFFVMGVIYWFWSGENAGSMMLVASGGLGFLPGSYYLWWSNRMRVRASDRDDATIAEGAGFVETFPGSSIWPFTLGMGAFFIGLALVFGTWFGIPAAGLVVWALLGAVNESRRGADQPSHHA
jgi:Cytochrome c oxidase subunit IV